MWPLLGLVLKWVGAAAAGYSAYSSYETGKASAKQVEVNAEAEAKQAAADVDQERLNRQSDQKAEAKQALRRRSAIEAAYAKSGVLIEGTPGQFLQEQAGIDELNIQQRTRASQALTAGMGVRAKNLSILGRAKSDALRSKAGSDLAGGAFKTTGLAAEAAKATDTWLNQG